MSEFEKKASKALAGIQKSLSVILSRFGDPSVLRPVDLRDALGIDMNLAWKVSRLVKTADVFSIGKYLPGKKALMNFADLAGKAGVPEGQVEELLESSRQVELLVRCCAGSRKELEAMLAGLSTEERTGNDILHRRKSFEGNSYIFGVQSEAQISTSIILPSLNHPGMVDICRIRGRVGLCRTRPDVSWRVAGTTILDNFGRPRKTISRSLFPVEPGEPPVIREYSSPDLPRFGSVTDASGRKSFYLEGREIGLKSSIDIFTAEVISNSGALYRNHPGEGAALVNSSRTPTRRFTAEVYLPAEFSGCPWETEMWSHLFPVSDQSGMTPGDRLPLAEQTVHFRNGRLPVALAGVPCYTRLITDCFERAGGDIGTFSLLRITIEYPPVPSSLDLIVELPERPV